MTVPCLVRPVRPDLRGIRSLHLSEPLGFGSLRHMADVERWLFVLEPLVVVLLHSWTIDDCLPARSFPLVRTVVVSLDSLVDSLVDNSLVVRDILDWALLLVPFDSRVLDYGIRHCSPHDLFLLVVLLYHFA